MKLDKAISYYDGALKLSFNRSDIVQLVKWLKELQKLRKINNKNNYKSYTVTFWANVPEITYGLNILAKSPSDAIRKYRKMFPKMHPISAELY